MNIVDIAIIGILLLCMVAGYYQGFLRSALGMANFFVSILGAWAMNGALARALDKTNNIVPLLVYYSESSEMLGTVENVRTSIYELNGPQLSDLLSRLSLPHPLGSLLTQNIQNYAFAEAGASTLGDYLSLTIAHMSVNIVSYLIIFFILFVSLSIVIAMCDYVFKLPTLRYMDQVSGALVGFLQGVLLLFVVFIIIPVILAFLPFKEISQFIDSSQFANFYYHNNFILDTIRGVIRGG